MATLECILCSTIIRKKGDVNLVYGKREIDVPLELENLSFVVQPLSKHICRLCLNSIKQRATLKKRFDELNGKLLFGYQEKARGKGFAIKMKETAKRSLRFTESSAYQPPVNVPYHSTPLKVRDEGQDDQGNLPQRHLGEAEPRTSPILTESFQSTPSSSTLLHSADTLVNLPELVQTETATETIVSVEVQWRSKTRRRILPVDLSSLGKMLCRGTYAQVARAAWRNDKLREQLILLVVKEIDKECSGMCSSKMDASSLYGFSDLFKEQVCLYDSHAVVKHYFHSALRIDCKYCL